MRTQVEVSGLPGRWFLTFMRWSASGQLLAAGSYPDTFAELEDAKGVRAERERAENGGGR